MSNPKKIETFEDGARIALGLMTNILTSLYKPSDPIDPSKFQSGAVVEKQAGEYRPTRLDGKERIISRNNHGSNFDCNK